MLAAISFLTIFGRAGTPTARAVRFFPIVGTLIGAAVGYAWWGALRLWPGGLVAAAVAIAIDAATTGILHLDGLADSADGLLPPLDRPRRLAVMHDPAVGAFGAVTLVIVLLLRFAALATLSVATAAAGPLFPLALAALWCLSRTVMVVILGWLPYARPSGGLAGVFVAARHGGFGRLASGAAGAVLAAALTIAATGPRGLIALGCAGVAGAAVALLARRRIGGFTGDVLGAAGVVAETAGLLALAAGAS